MSHRGKEFTEIIQETEKNLRKLLDIPNHYEVLFTQGGGIGQFSGVPLNLLRKPTSKAAYIVTGSWSSKAYLEAQKYGDIDLIFDGAKSGYKNVPDSSDFQRESENSQYEYYYYCSNETINGVQYTMKNEFIQDGKHVVVCDMSSDFLSKRLNVSEFGVIFAGAQKNAGIAGLTYVIIRRDLIDRERANPLLPSFINYEILSKNKSVFNTPPTFSIYVSGLVLKWLLGQGGLEKQEQCNQAKADMLYGCIDSSNEYYFNDVHKNCRSKMNVVFQITKDGNPSLESQFVSEAELKGMAGLRGHRSVGGIRASIYNAISIEDVALLVDFMRTFQKTHPLPPQANSI